MLTKAWNRTRVLLVFAIAVTSCLTGVPIVSAAQTITIATTQPVYLVNAGQIARVGVKMTFTGARAKGTGLDRDLTLRITLGGSITAGSSGYAKDLRSTAVPGVDYVAGSPTVTFRQGTASGSVLTFDVATSSNADPSVALTINTSIACTAGCRGVTTGGGSGSNYNNDASTIVIKARGFDYLNAALSPAARAADLLSRMTLAEKVGQMTQAEGSQMTSALSTSNTSPNDIRAWLLGSLLSASDSNPTPNSPAAWADMVDGFQYRALATRLQIPLIYGIDAVHGNAHMVGGVVFPHNIGMGATHDPALSRQEGEVTAQETRSAGPQWTFGPCICVARDIRWGRTYESYGEDPALVELMETQIDGMQGPDPNTMSGMHILASAKHYAGDGLTAWGTGNGGRLDQGIDRVSRADWNALALAPYIPAVQVHHCGSIMPSYSSVDWTDDGIGNAIKMSANEELLTNVLKNNIGFDGFLISDYNALDMIPVPSPNPLPAPLNTNRAYQTMVSINAGMDMVMEPIQPAYKDYENALINLVNLGYVPQARIDDAVTRILIQKFALGLFEQPFTDRSTQDQIGSPANKAIARRAVAESQVLLKNSNNILPLGKTAKIYLAGSNADNLGNQVGGWTLSWQGASGAIADAPYATTIRAAIQNVVGAGNVTYSATATASRAGNDVGVVVVGETPYAEASGDVGTSGHPTLNLTAADATALTNVCNDLPCVVLIISGRPMTLTDAQLSGASAIVESWLPGTEGSGVADVLFGDADFTGRLSQSWPRTLNQEPLNLGDSGYDPLFPFGWGLRTGFSRARLQATSNSLAALPADAHIQAAVAYLDKLLAANIWNAAGSVTDPGQALQLLSQAADELVQTSADSYVQSDGVVTAALDVTQAAVVAAGGPSALTSPLIASADHQSLTGRPDLAVRDLAQAAGVVLPTAVSAVPAVVPTSILGNGSGPVRH